MSPMFELKVDLGEYLDRILETCVAYQVPMSKITLVLRDPDNEKRNVIISNEPSDDDIRHAVELALAGRDV